MCSRHYSVRKSTAAQIRHFAMLMGTKLHTSTHIAMRAINGSLRYPTDPPDAALACFGFHEMAFFLTSVVIQGSSSTSLTVAVQEALLRSSANHGDRLWGQVASNIKIHGIQVIFVTRLTRSQE